jgi:hypothetical protein
VDLRASGEPKVIQYMINITCRESSGSYEESAKDGVCSKNSKATEARAFSHSTSDSPLLRLALRFKSRRVKLSLLSPPFVAASALSGISAIFDAVLSWNLESSPVVLAYALFCKPLADCRFLIEFEDRLSSLVLFAFGIEGPMG